MSLLLAGCAKGAGAVQTALWKDISLPVPTWTFRGSSVYVRAIFGSRESERTWSLLPLPITLSLSLSLSRCYRINVRATCVRLEAAAAREMNAAGKHRADPLERPGTLWLPTWVRKPGLSSFKHTLEMHHWSLSMFGLLGWCKGWVNRRELGLLFPIFPGPIETPNATL